MSDLACMVSFFFEPSCAACKGVFSAGIAMYIYWYLLALFMMYCI